MIDMAGLAQKGGAVTSHIRLAKRPEDISAIRIGPGGADLLLGCDSLVSADSAVLKLIGKKGHVVANSYEMPTGDFTRNADQKLPVAEMADRLKQIVPEGQSVMVDATQSALALVGDSIAANLFLLGVAFQRGLLPLSSVAIEQAIRLNNIAIEQSLRAFAWGRQWVVDPAGIDQILADKKALSSLPLDRLEQIIADRVERLRAYQNEAYARDYERQVSAITQLDTHRDQLLSKAVARYLYKMMAIKDEYEIGRLYSDGQFGRLIDRVFTSDVRLSVHLAPPLFSRHDPITGRPQKRQFKGWIWPAFKLLYALRGLRGGIFDLFGYTQERKAERKALSDYRAMLAEIADKLNETNYDIAVEMASVPEFIRGFGPVRAAHMAEAENKWAVLGKTFKQQNTTAVNKKSA